MNKENWTLEQWLEHDPEGLNALQSSNPLKFEQLNAAYYGSGTINASNNQKGINVNENWTLEQWLDHDPEGLNALQSSNHLKFEQLNAAYYGSGTINASNTLKGINVNENWTLEQWLDHDPEGLNALQSSNPLKFEQLNVAYYGSGTIKELNNQKTDKEDWSIEKQISINASFKKASKVNPLLASIQSKFFTGIWKTVGGKLIDDSKNSKGLSYKIG